MQSLKHVTVLVNPAAASGNGHKEWLRLQPHFEEQFADKSVEVIETSSRQQASELGASLNTDLIISLSGDGAIFDIAQGLMRRPPLRRPSLTTIPIGSGNDLAKALGLPMNPWLAISRLARGQRSLIDVGRVNVGQVNEYYYLNTLSFGIDALIAERTAELRKATRRRGFLLYAQAAVAAILHELKPHFYRMVIDDEYQERELLICAVQNGPYYGGGFKVAPRALLNDGLFSICMTGPLNSPTALYYMARLAKGLHEKLPKVEMRTARRLSLDFRTPIAVQCDGEKIEASAAADGSWHYQVELLPQVLSVISVR